MAVKKKTIKDLNEELGVLVTRVYDLENIVKDLALKISKKNTNEDKINEINEKVSTHDFQLNEIHKTIENSNSSTEKLKNCSECDLTFKTKSLLRKQTEIEHWTPTVKV